MFTNNHIKQYRFEEKSYINNYLKDSWTIGYTSNYTMAVWQGFDAIDGPTKYMTQDDTQKTQALYRINMQNIVRIHPPKGFSVPGNVGSINGGVKVISDSERRQIEEQNRREQEERSRNNNNDNNNNNRNNNSDDDNSNNNQNDASNDNNNNQSSRGNNNNATVTTPGTRNNNGVNNGVNNNTNRNTR